MRLVLAMVLAGLAALPLSASAQAGEEGASAEPTAEEPAPSSQPAPEEPALELQLDDAGVEVAPSPPQRHSVLDELEVRKLIRPCSAANQMARMLPAWVQEVRGLIPRARYALTQ